MQGLRMQGNDGWDGGTAAHASRTRHPPSSLPTCVPTTAQAGELHRRIGASVRVGECAQLVAQASSPPLHTHPMHPTRARRLLSSPTLSLAQPTAAHAPWGRAMQVTACTTHLGENKQRQEGSTRRRHVRSAQASCTGASQHQQRPAPVASTLLPGREGVTMLTNDRMVYGVALTAAPLSIQPSSSRCLSSGSHHLALQVQASACLSLCSRALPAPALAPRPLGCSSPPLLR